MASSLLLDDIITKRIILAVEKGLPRRTTAKLARISPATYNKWLAAGKAGDPVYKEFYDRVSEAEARGEEELVGIIRKAAHVGTWQAAAWLLERRIPKKYGLRKPDMFEKPMSDAEAEAIVAKIKSLP